MIEEAERRGMRALRQWITGDDGEFTRVFLVEPQATAAALADIVEEGDAVLHPEGSRPCALRALAVPYRGSLAEAGDELHIGEIGAELQDYVAAGFIQIVGPTAVRLTDVVDLQAFLDDADLARRTGIFPSALLDPRVLLADRHALAAPTQVEIPRALRLRADGRVSVGLRRQHIGTIDELPALLAAPGPRVLAGDGMTTGADPADGPTSREGIARYLGATDLMKMLRLSNGDARVAGYGWSPFHDRLADAEPQMSDPFLIETGDGFMLADPITLRRQLLSPETAGIVAATQTSSTADVAAERVSRQLDASVSDARGLCLEAVAALDVHFGRPAGLTAPLQGMPC